MSRPHPLLISLIITLLLIPAFRASAQDTPPPPTLVSLSSTGEPGNGPSSSPSLSADGRWIAFASDATNLVLNDTNGVTDIFVHDRQTGETTRVSVSTNGEQGNGEAAFPAISGNGRYVAFESNATNLVPGDSNGMTDIFVHDRLTEETKRVSVSINGEQANARSSFVSISHDGRYLTFESQASNLIKGDNNGRADVYLYDQGVTANITRASISSDGIEGNNVSMFPSISGDGRIVVFISEASNLISNDTNEKWDIFVYNRVLAQTERVSIGVNNTQSNEYSTAPSISYSGRYVVFFSPSILAPGGIDGLNVYQRDLLEKSTNFITNLPDDTYKIEISITDNGQNILYQSVDATGGKDLFLQNLRTGARETLLSNIGEIIFDPSIDGNVISFADSAGNVFVIDRRTSTLPTYFLSGRVTDPGVGDNPGHPLALVTVTDPLGNSTRTDLNGYFWLSGYKPGPVTLTLEKEGYSFQSSVFSGQLSEDLTGLNFIAFPEKPLAEARLNLGMPYQFDRGCPDPYIGCGGKYHGFTSGYCTDLILDAYTYGADFDIQFDLEQNTRAHPEHFYRWHDARDAHDMWRFFSYSGQMLPNTAPYAPGDIVFFDWTEDGEIDHVALVSEVDANHHPVKLLDATGKTDFNPSGLAAELPWQEFYDRTARGHARWSGAYQPVIPFPARTQMLQIAASGANVNLRLTDNAGGALSLTENTLPAGWYTNLIWEESASVEIPEEGAFTAEISNPTGEPAPFRLAIQLVVHGIVIGRVEASGNLPAGATRSIPIFVELDENGVYQLTAFPSRIPKIRGPLK